MTLIDGKKVAATVLDGLKGQIAAHTSSKPCVAFIRVGDDPASVYYVASKEKTANQIGAESRLYVFPETISQDQLLTEVEKLNADPAVHGILVQSPLPSHIHEQTIFDAVYPDKDVDGLNSRNQGLLCQEDDRAFLPCTPSGCIELLRAYGINPTGKHAVVVGRSVLVGKPAALLLMQKKAMGNATVTLCHSRTPDLASFTRQADILIAAIGKPEVIKGHMIKPGAVVIDVGINRVPDTSTKKGYRIVGDVDFAEASEVASYLTPVPGGVGLMTVAMLMANTVRAWKRATGQE